MVVLGSALGVADPSVDETLVMLREEVVVVLVLVAAGVEVLEIPSIETNIRCTDQRCRAWSSRRIRTCGQFDLVEIDVTGLCHNAMVPVIEPVGMKDAHSLSR